LSALLFLYAFLPASADVYAGLGAYPLTKDSFDRMMVGVRVNGMGPYPFIIDTGAGRSVFYRTLTVDARLQAEPNISRRILTADGYKRAQIYKVDSLYALGQSLAIEDTVALPDISGSVARGLLGVDLLMGRTLLIQPSLMTANLHDGPEAVEQLGWAYEQGRPVAVGSLALEIEVGGVTVPVLVDTGASDTVINTAGAETLLRSARGISREQVMAVIARGNSVAREKLILSEIHFAGRHFPTAQVYVADIAIFRMLGAARVPAIILGMDVLGKQGFAVDFANWRLYMEPESKAE